MSRPDDDLIDLAKAVGVYDDGRLTPRDIANAFLGLLLVYLLLVGLFTLPIGGGA